jgi:hypothetical protein
MELVKLHSTQEPIVDKGFLWSFFNTGMEEQEPYSDLDFQLEELEKLRDWQCPNLYFLKDGDLLRYMIIGNCNKDYRLSFGRRVLRLKNNNSNVSMEYYRYIKLFKAGGIDCLKITIPDSKNKQFTQETRLDAVDLDGL